ncbi:MAG: pyridoxal kinase [Rhodospirillales bacterium]
MNILSIQSWVACGHVGNAAAMFPLQRLGAEVMAIHTTQLSNHLGHGAYTGRSSTPEEVATLVAGLAAHGALARCDAVLSGFVGAAGIGDVILDAVARVRAANAAALWCCDPVMGDDGKFYVGEGIAEFFSARAVPAADILIPNQFELNTLTGGLSGTLTEAKATCLGLQARMREGGPRIVLVSSLRTAETPADALDMLLAVRAVFSTFAPSSFRSNSMARAIRWRPCFFFICWRRAMPWVRRPARPEALPGCCGAPGGRAATSC